MDKLLVEGVDCTEFRDFATPESGKRGKARALYHQLLEELAAWKETGTPPTPTLRLLHLADDISWDDAWEVFSWRSGSSPYIFEFSGERLTQGAAELNEKMLNIMSERCQGIASQLTEDGNCPESIAQMLEDPKIAAALAAVGKPN
jgi:hypothetical protein